MANPWQIAVVVLGLVSTLPYGQSGVLSRQYLGDPEDLELQPSAYQISSSIVPFQNKYEEDLEDAASEQEDFYEDLDDFETAASEDSSVLSDGVDDEDDDTEVLRRDRRSTKGELEGLDDEDAEVAPSNFFVSSYGVEEFVEDSAKVVDGDQSPAATGYDDFSHHDDHSFHDSSGFDKSIHGSHHSDFDKDFHDKHSKDYGGHKKGSLHHGSKHSSKSGRRGHKFGDKGHRRKQHRTKGFKNVYHKEEFGKSKKFFDDSDHKTFHNKYNDGHKKFHTNHGDKHYGKDYHGGQHFNKHGSLGRHKHGSFHSDKSGHKKHFGSHGSHGHFGGFGDYSQEQPTYVLFSDVSSESSSI